VQADRLHLVEPEATVPTNLKKRKRGSKNEELDMSIKDTSSRFLCPIFQDEIEQGLPHTCNGWQGHTMSGLRSHLKRGTKTRKPHLTFLERCKTCNDDIIDETDFKDNHNSNCHTPHPLRKGKAAERQYQMLCAKIVNVRAAALNVSNSKCIR
jgi:hypothetical protein